MSSGDAASGAARRLGGYWLSIPALLFLTVFFLVPLLSVLLAAVFDQRFSSQFEQTTRLLQAWSGEQLPDEETYRTIAGELLAARGNKTIANVDRRLAQEEASLQGLLTSSARGLANDGLPSSGVREALIAIDLRWQDTRTWKVLRRISDDLTPTYLLAALDLRRNADGGIETAPPEQAIYVPILVRSLVISLVVTLATLVLGAPVAFVMANVRPGWRGILFVLVQIPFWTSILVRLAAWIVLLQNQGPINQALMTIGLIDAPVAMMYNRIAVYIAMTHVQLPLMILPIYSVIQNIKTNYVRAALSLGASPLRAFITVYLPLAAPGIGAGVVLVFISSLGYYITPAIVGGAGDQMLSYFVQFHLDKLNNGLAAALASILILSTGLVFLGGRIASRLGSAARPTR